ncbi:MAG TPA: hypothetical protein DCQ99_06205 [Nitrospinae bacterium]|nr:hypothetical protein [Nitrospinota bacterium]HBA27482.1 hypothetical protein [Nitrospinota bacterium]
MGLYIIYQGIWAGLYLIYNLSASTCAGTADRCIAQAGRACDMRHENGRKALQMTLELQMALRR